ncbi:hypothetical protein GQ54DRAFT_298390 [Martensiomyces pterosporus]|nr:hypothetical protein GQ54DRAFT_298390 [Martensiomyces pterosporus]
MRSTILASSLVLLASHSAAYDISNSASLNCRKGPSTSYDIVKMYELGDDIGIVCQTTGESVYGSTIWDYTPDGCYVSDYYVRTGYSGIWKSHCDVSSLTVATSAASGKPTASSAKKTTATELGPIGSDISESSSSHKKTKVASSSSNELSSSAAPTSTSSSAPKTTSTPTLSSTTKPNGAASLAVTSGNVVVLGAALAYMLASL